MKFILLILLQKNILQEVCRHYYEIKKLKFNNYFKFFKNI